MQIIKHKQNHEAMNDTNISITNDKSGAAYKYKDTLRKR